MKDDQELRSYIRAIHELPTLPVSCAQIMEVAEQEYVDIEELADIIARDPAISARLLRLANSAYYGRSGRVSTIKQVIVTVGIEEVKAFSIGIAAFSAYLERVPLVFLQDLWSHSLSTAIIVTRLKALVDKGDAGNLYMAALLHDLGKLVFVSMHGSAYTDALDGVSGSDAVRQEETLWGIDHADLGGRLAEHWKLPEQLVGQIRLHHQVDPAEGEEFCAGTIAAADFIARNPHSEHWDTSQLTFLTRHTGLDSGQLTAVCNDWLLASDESSQAMSFSAT